MKKRFGFAVFFFCIALFAQESSSVKKRSFYPLQQLPLIQNLSTEVRYSLGNWDIQHDERMNPDSLNYSLNVDFGRIWHIAQSGWDDRHIILGYGKHDINGFFHFRYGEDHDVEINTNFSHIFSQDHQSSWFMVYKFSFLHRMIQTIDYKRGGIVDGKTETIKAEYPSMGIFLRPVYRRVFENYDLVLHSGISFNILPSSFIFRLKGKSGVKIQKGNFRDFRFFIQATKYISSYFSIGLEGIIAPGFGEEVSVYRKSVLETFNYPVQYDIGLCLTGGDLGTPIKSRDGREIFSRFIWSLGISVKNNAFPNIHFNDTGELSLDSKPMIVVSLGSNLSYSNLFRGLPKRRWK